MAIFGENPYGVKQGYWDGNKFVFPEAELPMPDQPTDVNNRSLLQTKSLLPDSVNSMNKEDRDHDRGDFKNDYNKSDFSNYGQGSATFASGYNTSPYSTIGNYVAGPLGGLVGSGIGLAQQTNQARQDFGNKSFTPNVLEAMIANVPVVGGVFNSRDVLSQAADDYRARTNTALNNAALTAFAKSGTYSGPKGVVGPTAAQMGRDVNRGDGLGGQNEGSRAGAKGGRNKAGHGGYGPSF